MRRSRLQLTGSQPAHSTPVYGLLIGEEMKRSSYSQTKQTALHRVQL